MPDDTRYLLGIDVGTTAVKGGLFSLSGEIIGHASRQYPTTRTRHCHVEQNPGHWLAAIAEILDELLDEHTRPLVAAMGICSQVNTHVFVDHAGIPLLPAIVWQDGRAAPEAEELDQQVTKAQKQAWWGMPAPIDASHALSRMAWVAKYHPDEWSRTRWVLSPKDYCLLHITGEAASDPVSSFGLVDQTGEYVQDLLDLVPGADRRLPPLQPMDRIIGRSRAEFCNGLNVPMVTGTMDAWGNLFGSGVASIGEGAYFSGTSEIVALVSDKRISAEGVVSFLPVKGWHVHAGPTQSGGDSLRWYAESVAQPIDGVLEHASAVDRHQQKAMFLPHLQGERAPFWDPYSRGTFLGIEADTGMGEMAIAVMEGVACSARLLYESVARAAGQPYDFLYLGGGGSQSDLWCQIRADVLNMDLKRLTFLDTGVLGAAILAGAGAGLFPSIPRAAQQMVKVDRIFKPDPAFRERYDTLISLYETAYRALKPFYKRMHTQ